MNDLLPLYCYQRCGELVYKPLSAVKKELKLEGLYVFVCSLGPLQLYPAHTILRYLYPAPFYDSFKVVSQWSEVCQANSTLLVRGRHSITLGSQLLELLRAKCPAH